MREIEAYPRRIHSFTQEILAKPQKAPSFMGRNTDIESEFPQRKENSGGLK